MAVNQDVVEGLVHALEELTRALHAVVDTEEVIDGETLYEAGEVEDRIRAVNTAVANVIPPANYDGWTPDQITQINTARANARAELARSVTFQNDANEESADAVSAVLGTQAEDRITLFQAQLNELKANQNYRGNQNCKKAVDDAEKIVKVAKRMNSEAFLNGNEGDAGYAESLVLLQQAQAGTLAAAQTAIDAAEEIAGQDRNNAEAAAVAEVARVDGIQMGIINAQLTAVQTLEREIAANNHIQLPLEQQPAVQARARMKYNQVKDHIIAQRGAEVNGSYSQVDGHEVLFDPTKPGTITMDKAGSHKIVFHDDGNGAVATITGVNKYTKGVEAAVKVFKDTNAAAEVSIHVPTTGFFGRRNDDDEKNEARAIAAAVRMGTIPVLTRLEEEDAKNGSRMAMWQTVRCLEHNKDVVTEDPASQITPDQMVDNYITSALQHSKKELLDGMFAKADLKKPNTNDDAIKDGDRYLTKADLNAMDNDQLRLILRAQAIKTDKELKKDRPAGPVDAMLSRLVQGVRGVPDHATLTARVPRPR